MNVVVIDGQSGRMGQMFIERATAANLPCQITAVGTNAIATSAMLKAGAEAGATGENPVLVACRTADVIVGPIGILAADSLMGEITPTMRWPSAAATPYRGRTCTWSTFSCRWEVPGAFLYPPALPLARREPRRGPRFLRARGRPLHPGGVKAARRFIAENYKVASRLAGRDDPAPLVPARCRVGFVAWDVPSTE